MKKYLRPVGDRKVRYCPPSPQVLPPEGREVTWSVWWASKLKEGDVIVCDPPAPQVQATPAEEV